MAVYRLTVGVACMGHTETYLVQAEPDLDGEEVYERFMYLDGRHEARPISNDQDIEFFELDACLELTSEASVDPSNVFPLVEPETPRPPGVATIVSHPHGICGIGS